MPTKCERNKGEEKEAILRVAQDDGLKARVRQPHSQGHHILSTLLPASHGEVRQEEQLVFKLRTPLIATYIQL